MSEQHDPNGIQTVVAWVLASLASIGGLIAAAWGWVQQQRRKKEDERGISWKAMFVELKKDLKMAQQGLKDAANEVVECRIERAKQEERLAAYEKRQGELETEVVQLRAEVRQLREATQ